MAESSRQTPPGCSTICLPIDEDRYQKVVSSPEEFRLWLNQAFLDMPELFRYSSLMLHQERRSEAP